MYSIYTSLMQSCCCSQMYYEINHASMMTHWSSYSARTGPRYEQLLRGTLYANQTSGQAIIKNFYQTIGRCNTLLAGLENSPIEDSFKIQEEAEARFVRAVCYFYLVRMFGDVPLILTPTNTLQEAYVGRDSFNEVYAQILEDLIFAENNMRGENEQLAVSGANGRPHKWAATAYKASVYVQIGSILGSPDDQAFGTIRNGAAVIDENTFAGCTNTDTPDGITSADQAWTLALATAESVIESGQYELAHDYRELFAWDRDNPAVYNLKERILVMQSTSNGGGSAIAQYTLPEKLYGTENLSQEGRNERRVNPNRWIYYKWCETYEGALTSAEKTAMEKKGYRQVYVCADPRLDASYIHTAYEVYDGDWETRVTSYAYPAEYKSGNSWKSTITGRGKDSSPHFKKYMSRQFKQDYGYADYYLMRYAEVYLMAAEAAAELDQNDKAYSYIETLHARARISKDGAASTMPSWSDKAFTKEELISAIMWERVFELSGEGHEWFDNHRRGGKWLLRNIYAPLHEFFQIPENESYSSLFWYNEERGNYTLPLTLEDTRKGLLCEYPEYEIRYNPALDDSDQNFYNTLNFGSGSVENTTPGVGNENFDSTEEDMGPVDAESNTNTGNENFDPSEDNLNDGNGSAGNENFDPSEDDLNDNNGSAGNENFDPSEDNLNDNTGSAGNENFDPSEDNLNDRTESPGNESFDPSEDDLNKETITAGNEGVKQEQDNLNSTDNEDYEDNTQASGSGNQGFNKDEDNLNAEDPTHNGSNSNESFDQGEDNINGTTSGVQSQVNKKSLRTKTVKLQRTR